MNYYEIEIGQRALLKHLVTWEDIQKFVDLTGDDNKLHVDFEFAKNTEFKKPVVHGMLSASFISTIIGTKLPGNGALWYHQSLDFLLPVRINDEITVIAEVIKKNDANETIELKINILNQYKETVTKGISKVKVLKTRDNIDSSNKENNLIIDNHNNDISKTEKTTTVILGASGGIGLGIAKSLANKNHNLILQYNNNYSELELLKKIYKNSNIELIRADLNNDNELADFTDIIFKKYSKIDSIINCLSGPIPNIEFEKLDWSLFELHFSLNIKSNYFLINKLIPYLKKSENPSIVFISSQAIESPVSGNSYYITAKSALHGFAKALSLELAKYKIRVNLISPSLIDTNLTYNIPPKIKMLTSAKTPLKKLCVVDDVVNATEFLISNQSCFITGETIRINGGQTMI